MRNPISRDLMSRFRKFFGRPVQDFICPITGFDVIKFDEWAETPDGVSCHDHVERKFGKGSASVIKALIDTEAIG